jgi:hypothetical protein
MSIFQRAQPSLIGLLFFLLLLMLGFAWWTTGNQLRQTTRRKIRDQRSGNGVMNETVHVLRKQRDVLRHRYVEMRKVYFTQHTVEPRRKIGASFHSML